MARYAFHPPCAACSRCTALLTSTLHLQGGHGFARVSASEVPHPTSNHVECHREAMQCPACPSRRPPIAPQASHIALKLNPRVHRCMAAQCSSVFEFDFCVLWVFTGTNRAEVTPRFELPQGEFPFPPTVSLLVCVTDTLRFS